MECDTKIFANNVRKLILEMIYRSQCSHIGSALSCVDILTVLYKKVMKHDPLNPGNPDRDRLIFSKGHACTALYGVLAECGYFSKDLLLTYAKDNSILMSHVSSKVPGVEFSTGSLGHGLPVSLGIALGGKKRNNDYTVFTVMSDGELNEGSNYEAIMLAAHLGIDNLVVIVDCNKFQAMGNTKDIINLEPIENKFKVFGWDVDRIDGHDHDSLMKNIATMKNKRNGTPKVIIADTLKGKGISFMENKLEWHYKSPKANEYNNAVDELEDHK